jgi:hypothetical protein
VGTRMRVTIEFGHVWQHGVQDPGIHRTSCLHIQIDRSAFVLDRL